MFRVYYQPQNVWFDQRDTRRPGPFGEPFGWALATTSDFVHYQDHGEVLERGDDGDQDQFVFAGSVFQAGDTFHAMYTGYNRDYPKQNRPSQVLMHATSDDLVHWTKTDRSVVLPQSGYDPDDWRDPYVLWDEERGEYVLILGARALEGERQLTGRTVLFTSDDLDHWRFQGDLWAPGLYSMHEMPDLFRIGDYWYLLTTEYSSESKTVYRMSTSLRGPWTSPIDDAFDGRAYYAARSVSDGDRRYLVGWVPTKEKDDDLGDWQWGGTLVVHEVFQRENGSLAVRAPDPVTAAFTRKQVLLPEPTALEAVDSLAERYLTEETGDRFTFEATFRFSPGTRRIDVRLFEAPASGVAYAFSIRPQERVLSFDRRGTYRWNTYNGKGLTRYIDLASDVDHHLRVIADGSIATIYVDGTALNARMYDKSGPALAMDVVDGWVEIRSATLRRLED